ncbi:MAG: CHAT domain-containing tetratricopeptide repeat protein [Capsulimonadales bacterium]|nr:CHAT domain-containing tetratricopeptide repeat protein [Capsulimonadales bacterium]
MRPVTSARDIVGRLLEESSDARRESLLLAAAREPECLTLLLEAAWDAARADPVESLRRADLVDAVCERAPLGTQTAATRAQAARVRVRGFQALGRYADVVRETQNAARVAREAGDPLLTATVQIGAVDALGRLNRVPEAFALGNQLVEELLSRGAPEEAARVLVNIGILRYRQDEYTSALDAYRQAAAIFLERNDTLSLARTWLNAAIALTSLNRIEEAIELYESALDIFTGQEMPVFAATAETNLGFLYYVSGRYALALQSLDRARLAFTQIGDNEGAAQADTDSGDAYRSLNLLPEALDCYERAAATFAQMDADYDRARAEFGRAAILLAQHRDAEAFAAMEEASSIFHRQRNAVQSAHVHLLRAHFFDRQGRADEADASAFRAARVFSRARLSGWAAEARWLPVARALAETGAGTRRMASLVRIARREGRGWLECRAERALGRYFAGRSETGRALRHFRASVAALERTRTLIAPEELHTAYLRDKMSAYEEIVGTLLTRGRRQDIIEALEYVERAKSRLLLERLLTTLENPASATRRTTPARVRLAELRAQLSVNYHRTQDAAQSDNVRRLGGSPAGRTDESATLSALEKAYEEAAHRVEQEDGANFTLSAVVAPSAIQNALRPDETLVEFYLVGDAISVFIMNRGAIRACARIANWDSVAPLARRLRYQLQKMALRTEYTERYSGMMQTEIRETLGGLYSLLFAPLVPFLADSEALVVVPHGPLHGLPFHLFQDGEAFLLDRWEFLYAPSAAVWYTTGRRSASDAPAEKGNVGPASALTLLMGLPSPTLTRITEEITELKELLPDATAYLGDEATLENFHRQAGHCSVLHLATHAMFRADNPLFSGLQFANGWLLARDLYQIRLRCDLATLSACRTGVGQVDAGDELFGIPRGFLSAGARSVAASLWPVDDAATTYLMTRFYRHLNRSGLNRSGKAAALRAAQRETREAYPHPYYWGAFILMGER